MYVLIKPCSNGAAVSGMEAEKVLMDYYIPDYILLPGIEAPVNYEVPACPVIVFINSKSGGQLGGELLLTYRSLLNQNQVYLFLVCL